MPINLTIKQEIELLRQEIELQRIEILSLRNSIVINGKTQTARANIGIKKAKRIVSDISRKAKTRYS